MRYLLRDFERKPPLFPPNPRWRPGTAMREAHVSFRETDSLSPSARNLVAPASWTTLREAHSSCWATNSWRAWEAIACACLSAVLSAVASGEGGSLLAKAEAPLSIGVWRFSGACELGRLVLFKNFLPNPHLRASSFDFFVPFWTLLVPFPSVPTAACHPYIAPPCDPSLSCIPRFGFFAEASLLCRKHILSSDDGHRFTLSWGRGLG